MTTSVVLVGVGGQGILLASEILAQAAVFMGFDVKTNEVHGMAQRGGSVVTQVRFGREVFSPLVPRRSAQVLGSLERIEGLRNIDYLAEGGLAVISSQKIIPVTASTGGTPYPNIDEKLLLQYFPRLVYIDAVEQATKIGNAKAANTILLGAMATKLSLPLEAWIEAIRRSVKEKLVDINIKTFKQGFKIAGGNCEYTEAGKAIGFALE